MVQVFSVLAVVVSALTFGAVAFPTGPGTCLVTGMTGVPHGAMATTTGGNYSIAIKAPTVAAGSYTVTISGTGNFTGLLLYAVDSTTNNTRFGSFVKPPTGLGPHAGCGGVNPTSNTLGHLNANVKKLPLQLTWTPAGYNSAQSFVASFTGIVMTADAKVWHVLSAKTVTIAPANATTNATTSMMSSAASTSVIPTSTLSANGNTTDMGNGTSSSSTAAHHVSSSLALVAVISFAVLLI